jgi:hypothetical protein
VTLPVEAAMLPREPRGTPAGPSAAPSIVYHQPVCSGTIPVGRWGFCSAVVGSSIFVFGGVGPSILDDLAFPAFFGR